MEYLEGFKARMGSNVDNTRNRKIDDARARVIKHFEDDPSFFALNAIEPDNPNSVVKRVRVINESVLRQINPERVYSKYIIPHPEETLVSGTMVFGLYQADWLVTAVTGLGDVTQQGMLQMLNDIITVKSPTGDNAIPAVLNEVSRLGAGVLETNLAIMPNRLVKVRVQENAVTRAIKTNTRFRAQNSMFTVMKRDLSTDENVINWIAREDLEEYGDDTPTPAPVAGKIEGPNTIVRARDYIYTAPEGAIKEWRIDGLSPENAGVVTVTPEIDNMAVVRAKVTKLITFTLTAVYMDDSEITKEIRLVSLL